MEISLFQHDEPLRFERVVFYPYPDLKRIWVRLWTTAHQDKRPNVEIRILNPDQTENTSMFLLALDEQRIERTIHLRDPVPGTTYRVVAEMTLGLSDDPELLDHQEFDMVLEFRNPERNEPGFGIGVDWSKLSPDA